ncbi:hypothetical protein KSP35_21155 [Aquihabitans sp. G128]|uniref:hypothetical protein n=1 Tax=Aquihabitans sp. G128 TaxID=2849779 RepID=UPI001C2500C3|nr:hypothetical protein [Aquihabitans sp. G128]QXC60801.1 hypothetical protein KSP35_21155 [Aquihabitans sp. G128]
MTAVHRGTLAEPPPTWAEHGVTERRVDRASDDLDGLLAEGADLVVDAIAYDEADARRLLAHADDLGHLVVISSASVYADARGRTLDEATGVDDFPDFVGPIPETAATIAPGPASYSTRKRLLEDELLGQDAVPVTVLRPCAIHGPGSTSPRELWPLLRARSKRPSLPLAFGGESTFHTTSATNLAELIRTVAEQPGTRTLNHGDPFPHTVAEIAQVVAATVGHTFELVPFDGPSPGEGVGDSPWAVPKPFTVAMDAATALGYRPVTSYAAAAVDTCRWLEEQLDAVDRWEDAFPKLPQSYGPHFFAADAEDAWLAEHHPHT